MRNPRPESGARDRFDAGELLGSNASVSTKSRAPNQAHRNGAAAGGRRAHFARQATIAAFGWRYAKSLDQGKFVDHPPRRTVRLPGAIVLDGGSP